MRGQSCKQGLSGTLPGAILLRSWAKSHIINTIIPEAIGYGEASQVSDRRIIPPFHHYRIYGKFHAGIRIAGNSIVKREQPLRPR
jgi:hypothetical protein